MKYRDIRLKKVKPETVTRKLNCLRYAYEVARRENIAHIPQNPVEYVRVNVTKLPLRFLSADELQRFFQHCPDRSKLIFTFLRYIGVRIAELMGHLKWSTTGIIWEEIDMQRRMGE